MYGFSYRELYEKGFSVDTLENARKFYLNYQGRISETLFRISGDDVRGRV